MMNKTALLHEAKQQQQALRQLSLWKRIAMLLSSCAAVLAGASRAADCASRAACAAWLSRWRARSARL